MTLRALITELALMPVEFNAGPLDVYYLESLKNRINTAALPHRRVQVFGVDNLTPGLEISYLGCFTNHLNYVDWTVQDTFLYKAAGAGTGLDEVEPVLVDYTDGYITTLDDFTFTGPYEVQSFLFNLLPYEYPQGTEEYYFSVVASLDIREMRI